MPRSGAFASDRTPMVCLGIHFWAGRWLGGGGFFCKWWQLSWRNGRKGLMAGIHFWQGLKNILCTKAGPGKIKQMMIIGEKNGV